MGRRSHHAITRRQREVKKREKARIKREKKLNRARGPLVEGEPVEGVAADTDAEPGVEGDQDAPDETAEDAAVEAPVGDGLG